jgi:MFS family permease
VGLLFAVMASLGIAALLSDVAAAAMVPALVDRPRLAEAHSRLQTSVAAARVAGPAAAGWLIEHFTAASSLLPGLALFGICALSFALFGPSHRATQSNVGGTSVSSQILAGVRPLMANPFLRGLVGWTTMAGAFGTATNAIFPLYASDLGLGPAQIGAILAAQGTGGLLGAGMSTFIARRWPSGWATLAAAVVCSGGFCLTPAAGLVPTVAAPLLVASRLVLGASLVIFNAHMSGLQQAATPADLQGRVFGSIRFTRYASFLIGSLAGGLLGEAIGLWATNMVAAIGVSLSLLWLWNGRVWQVPTLATPAT